MEPAIYTVAGDCPVIRCGQQILASECAGEMAMYARWALDARARGGFRSIAYVGGGTAVMPRLLSDRSELHVVYEIHPDIVANLRADFPWLTVVQGDWSETLSGLYDLIVYDLPGPAPLARLRSHLAFEGMLIHPN